MRWGSRAALGLALMTLLIPTVAAFQFFPEAKSQIQRDWQDLFMQVFWAALIVFILVEGLLLYALIRFRKRKDGPQEGPHIHGNTRMEIAWTIAPTLVMGWLLMVSLDYLDRVESQPAPDFTVDVWAEQFSWKFFYPPDYLNNESTTGKLYVEAGKRVEFRVRSTDVIHALNIPELGVMIDAVPGRINYFTVQIEEPGTYFIQCRELCGVGHGTMHGELIAFPPGTQARPYGPPPTPGEPEPQVPDNKTAPEGDVTVNVDLTEFKIDPNFVEAEPGQKVVFKVTNRGAASHNLYIGPSYNSAQPDSGATWKTSFDIAPGASEFLVVELPPEPGYFEMWCEVSGHRELDMRADFSTGGQKVSTERVPLLPGPGPVAILLGLVIVAFVLARRR